MISPRLPGLRGEAAPERAGGTGARRQLAATPPSPIVELCAFRVGSEEYVLDLRRIREILQPLPLTPIPRAPEFLEGVMDLRGEAIPVVDVRKRLGASPSSARPKVLVVNVAGRLLGLLVDAVSEVLRIPRSAIGPPPLVAAGPRLFLGVCGARERHVGGPPGAGAREHLRLLLNVKALLEPAAPAAASRHPGRDPSPS